MSEALLVERAQPKTAQGMNCDRTIKTGSGRPQRETQICLRSLSKVCPNSLSHPCLPTARVSTSNDREDGEGRFSCPLGGREQHDSRLYY